MPVRFSDIEDAAQRIAPYIHKTPLVQSSQLNNWLGHAIIFKVECLQKTGAFKARGACNAIANLIEQGRIPSRIIANSSGNHAQAIAWSSAKFGVPATLYMPEGVSAVKAQATRAYGAETIICENRVLTDQAVERASHDAGIVWIPPYNHVDVIAGQGTAAMEALRGTGDVDAVFAPCGGGGLLSGTLVATRYLCPKTAVLGVEPKIANDAAESLRKGSIQYLKESPDTLADGARTLAVGALTFPFLQQLDGFYEVSELQIAYWTQWLSHLLKLHVEPTSAMVMDGVVQWLSEQRKAQKVLVILSGGNLDSSSSANIWSRDHLITPPSLSGGVEF